MDTSQKNINKNIKNKPSATSSFLIGCFWGITILIILSLSIFYILEKRFQGKIYPLVTINGISFKSFTQKGAEAYWLEKNKPFLDTVFIFKFENKEASFSGADLNLGYDATLSGTQAYLVGRSGHLFSDFLTKFFLITDISPYFRWNEDIFDEKLKNLADQIDIPVQEALFDFKNGRVTAFKLSQNGRRLNFDQTKKLFIDSLKNISNSANRQININLPVESVEPLFTTDRINTFGIKELIGRGYSEFAGSIPGRIHNVALASAKLNGVLIKPGDTFSFNDAVGDISATTGFQQAYIIKEGRTILGDGGGVCQVSTTLFRAALNAGLPIIDRKAHAYRVHYYEEGGFKPGLDATVFAPSVDLKIKNDTPAYILIQTRVDTKNLTLTFELYGTSDGRKAEISNHKVWDITPPPPDLYQDDPTLPAGRVKQVDWAAWGAKASFDYRVTRNGEVLQNTSFFSNFRPWQAVYLKGTAL